jgi:predicted acylesterase/phospholipase RssA
MKAWVISGGGARIVQALSLIERHIKNGNDLPNLIVGSSAGGLLSFLIAHIGVDGAKREILNIRSRHDLFTGFMFFGPRNPGFWYSRPLEKLIARIQKSEKPKIKAFVCSLDMYTMRPIYFPVNDSPSLIASTACIPVLVEPIRKRFSDGGVIENTPLKFAIDQGADDIEVFLCSSDDRQPSLVGWKADALMKLFEAQRIEIARGDMRDCLSKNQDPAYNLIKLRFHQPKENLLGILDFDKMRSVYRILQSIDSTST